MMRALWAFAMAAAVTLLCVGVARADLEQHTLTLPTVAPQLIIPLDANGNLIYDSTQAMELGTVCSDSSTNGSGTGDVCTGGDFYLDAGSKLVLDADGDSYIYSDADDSVRILTGGAFRVTINSSEAIFGQLRANGLVYSSTGPLQLGTTCSDSGTNGSGTGDACTGGDFYLDAGSKVVFDADGDTYATSPSDDLIQFYTGGTSYWRIVSNQLTSYSGGSLNMNGGRVFDGANALQLGTAAATTHGLGTGDVLAGGDFEVDGTAYFDNQLRSEALFTVSSGVTNYMRLQSGVDDGTIMSLNMGGGADNGNLIITAGANRSKDHDHDIAATNPTLFIHSATDPDTDNAQWLSLSHDTDSGLITTGNGPLALGTDAATGHGLGAGDVLAGGALEVDGLAYFDETIYTANDKSIGIGGSSSKYFWLDYSTSVVGMRLMGTDIDGSNTDGALLYAKYGGDDLYLGRVGQKLYFDGDQGTPVIYIAAGATNRLDTYVSGVRATQTFSTGVRFADDKSVFLGDVSDYGLLYNSANTQLELNSTDGDTGAGAGTDVNVLTVNDGDTDITHTLDAKGATTTSGGSYEDLTCSASASLTTSGLIPDGAWLIGVTTRVTTALTTATDYSVGDGSDVDLYGVAGAVTQGTTTDNSDATATWSNPKLIAGEVTLTFTGTCDAGVIRVNAHYMTVGAATSN